MFLPFSSGAPRALCECDGVRSLRVARACACARCAAVAVSVRAPAGECACERTRHKVNKRHTESRRPSPSAARQSSVSVRLSRCWLGAERESRRRAEVARSLSHSRRSRTHTLTARRSVALMRRCQPPLTFRFSFSFASLRCSSCYVVEV